MKRWWFGVLFTFAGLCGALTDVAVADGRVAADTDAAQQRARQRRSAAPGTVSSVKWSDDGKFLYFTSQGQRYRFNLETREQTPEDGKDEAAGSEGTRSTLPTGRRRSAGDTRTGRYVGRPTRGRQYTQVNSPDGKWEAHYEKYNVVLKNTETGDKRQVTTAGNETVHYGTASWVYGEELRQTEAMWWTPDSKKLLFYKFNDSDVRPFYLVRGWSEINTDLYPEYYPKAGATNPTAELLIYDLETKATVQVDVGGDPDEYIFGVRASPGGDVMLVNWTDRLQHDLRVLAIDLETGKTRRVVEEHQETWQTNSPPMRYLADAKRFLWPTDKNGFTHYEVRDLDGKLHHPLTTGEFQTGGLTFVDEESGWVGFTAYSSEKNPYYAQYHLVRLDGSEQRRVTTLERHHSNFRLSPDRKWLVAQYEEVNTPPCTALYDADGKLVATLAETDPASAANLAEEFSFQSACGQFEIYGVLYKPSNFDPKKSYPLINSLYGGPGSNEYTPSYVSSERSECARGYLVARLNNRGTGRRGKAFLGATYLHLGDVDIQDHADGMRLLRKRPYVDGDRIGIVGHSYGGYMAAMGIFKHPDVYAASVVRAGVTDWRNYDTIYTERYMSTPQLNPSGYDVGAVMPYAKDLRGKVLIMHGMMDDNVHPNNAFQLIAALDKAGKTYESRFWPNAGHGLGRGLTQTQNEFFDRILKPNKD